MATSRQTQGYRGVPGGRDDAHEARVDDQACAFGTWLRSNTVEIGRKRQPSKTKINRQGARVLLPSCVRTGLQSSTQGAGGPTTVVEPPRRYCAAALNWPPCASA